MQLQVPRPLTGAGQRCHDDHELGESGSVAIGQHLGRHGDERAEEHGADALAHLAGLAHDVSGEQLQQLPVLLHRVQLIRVLGQRGRHARQPGLQARGLHTRQLGQRAAQVQQARVGALLRYRGGEGGKRVNQCLLSLGKTLTSLNHSSNAASTQLLSQFVKAQRQIQIELLKSSNDLQRRDNHSVLTSWVHNWHGESGTGLLTELKEFGEEFQHSVAELCRQILIGSCHHDLNKFPTKEAN